MRIGICIDKLIVGGAVTALLVAVGAAAATGYASADPTERLQFARELLAYASGLGTGLFALAQGKKAQGDTTVNASPTDSVTVNTANQPQPPATPLEPA